MLRHSWAQALLLAPALALPGCDLISSDLLKVSVQLPVETYTLDTADHTNVVLPPQLPDMACSDSPSCCASGCSNSSFMISCSPDHRCQAMIRATLVQAVDLSTDPNLAKAKSVASVTLRSIEYAICDNSFTVAIPAIEIWLAPEAVTEPDPAMGAKELGIVPMVEAGQDVTCPANRMSPDPSQFAKVQLLPDAQRTFSSFADNFKTRFNVIAVSTFLWQGGDPAPSGSMTIYVSGQADASLSL